MSAFFAILHIDAAPDTPSTIPQPLLLLTPAIARCRAYIMAQFAPTHVVSDDCLLAADTPSRHLRRLLMLRACIFRSLPSRHTSAGFRVAAIDIFRLLSRHDAFSY